jgi:hypothetical protein
LQGFFVACAPLELCKQVQIAMLYAGIRENYATGTAQKVMALSDRYVPDRRLTVKSIK